MPTYFDPLLPNANGLDLGSPTQLWDGFFNSISANIINGPVAGGTVSLQTANSSASMTFDGSAYNAFKITLIGNVTASTFTGVAGYYTFVILQDGAGGHTFAWPGSFVNAAAPSPVASGSLSQVFFWDGANGYALSPGMVFP